MNKIILLGILLIIFLLVGKLIFSLSWTLVILLVVLFGCIIAYLAFGKIEKDTETTQKKLIKKLKRQIK